MKSTHEFWPIFGALTLAVTLVVVPFYVQGRLSTRALYRAERLRSMDGTEDEQAILVGGPMDGQIIYVPAGIWSYVKIGGVMRLPVQVSDNPFVPSGEKSLLPMRIRSARYKATISEDGYVSRDDEGHVTMQFVNMGDT